MAASALRIGARHGTDDAVLPADVQGGDAGTGSRLPADAEQVGDSTHRLNGALQDGALTCPVAQVFDLADCAAAHEAVKPATAPGPYWCAQGDVAPILLSPPKSSFRIWR